MRKASAGKSNVRSGKKRKVKQKFAMDFDQTQVIALEEFDDDTDENISQSQKTPVAHLKVGCQKGVPEKLYPLYEGNNTVGRHEDCNVYIPSKALSKQHACVEIRGDSHLIYDSGSRNRTRRGMLFLTPNVRYELKHNDALVFADVHASYLIGSDVSRVDDSGSDTGSESMLQTVMATDSADVNPVLDETGNDDMSDASSDILQPTQPSSTVPSWTSGRMLEPTQRCVTESPDHVAGDLTVGETPLPKNNQSADLSTLVLPESDSEDDSDGSKANPQATLMFEEEKDTSGDQDLLGAPTQAFMLHTDTDEEEEEDPADKKNLMCAATQACGLVESDPEEDPKVDLFAPTLAVVQDSESDSDGSCIIDLNAPTQAVLQNDEDWDEDDEDDGDREVKTMAYEMDVEKERLKKGTKSEKTKSSGRVCAPTLAYDIDIGESKKPTKIPESGATVAYDMDTSGGSRKSSRRGRVSEPTVAYDLEEELKQAKKDDSGGSGSTQSFVVQEEKSLETEDPDDGGLVPTQVFEVEEEEKDEDEDVSHLLMTSTLACDMEEEDEEEEEVSKVSLGEKEAVQPAGDEDATQVFEEGQVATPQTGRKMKTDKNQNEDATQVFGDDATVAISEPSEQEKSNEKCNEATQVFGDDATLAVNEPSPKQKKSRKQPESDATQVLSDETQVFGDDATLAVTEPSPKQKKSKKKSDNDATQVLNEGATQVFEEDAVHGERKSKQAGADDATLMVSDNNTTSEDATQVFEEATVAVSEVDDKPGEDATQVCEEATLAVSEVEDKPGEDATQVCEEATVAVSDVEDRSGEGATQMFGVEEPTLLVSDAAKSDADTDATQVFDCATLKVEEKQDQNETTDDSTQVFGDATVAIEEEQEIPSRKRGRGKKSGKANVEMTEAEATVAIEEEAEMPARKRGRGKKVQSSVDQDTPTVPIDVDHATMDATMAVESEPEPVRQGRGRGRGRGRGKKTAEAIGEDSHRVRGGVKRGRRSNDTEDATMPVADVGQDATVPAADMEDATMAVDDVGQDATLPAADVDTLTDTVPVDKGQDTTVSVDDVDTAAAAAPGGKTSDDSDSEDSTLPVEEVINMAEVEGHGTRTSGRKNTEKPSTVASPRSRGRQTAKTTSSGDGTDVSDLEPTQLYGADEVEATQQYGLDSTEEMVPDSHSNEKVPSPMIPLPERSPHKSALASPKRSPSPSPKRVAFAAGVADNENKTKKMTGLARGRGRGRRSLDVALGDADVAGADGGRRKSMPGRVAVVERLETGLGRGRGRRRGAGEQIIVKEEPVAENAAEVNMKELKVRSVRGKETVVLEEKKEETMKRGRKEIVVEVNEDETVTRGRGRKEVVEKKEEESVTRGRGRKGVVVEKEEETVTRGRGRKEVVDEKKEEETVTRGRGRKEVVVEREEETVTRGRGRKEVVVEKEEETVTRGRGRKEVVLKEDETSKTGRKEVVEKKEEETVRRGRGRKEIVLDKNEEETVRRGRGRKEDEVETKEDQTPKRGRAEVVLVNKKEETAKRGRKEVEIKEEENVRRGRGRKEVVEKKAEETTERLKKEVVVERKEETPLAEGTRRSSDVSTVPGRKSKGKTSHTAAEGGETTDSVKEEPESVETEEKSSEELNKRGVKGRGRMTSQEVTNDPVKEETNESDVTTSTRRGRTRISTPSAPPAVLKRNTSGRKSLPAALSSQDEPKSTRRGRSTEKSETISETENRKSRTGSGDSVKSSLESSVDESKSTKRVGRGKKQTEELETMSKSVSQTKHVVNESQDLNVSGFSDSGRGRRSDRQSGEITVPKGKGKTLSKTSRKGLIEPVESPTKSDDAELETRTSVRKRPSEEGVDLPFAKRGRRGAKGSIETPDSDVSELIPSRRKRGKDSSSAEEASGSITEDSAKGTGEKDETEVSSAKKGKKSVARRTLSAGRGRNSVEDQAESSQGTTSDVESTNLETSRASRRSKAPAIAQAPEIGMKRKKGGKVDASQDQESSPTPAKKSRSSDSSPPRGKQKQGMEMSSPSLRRKSTEPKPRVLFTGVVDEQGQKIVKELGGGLATSIRDCTHLVTDKVRRTVKFLGGVARGVPIVTLHWLNNSKSAGTFLDCSKFLVSDTAKEKQYKFSLKKSLAKAAEENLLQGYKIHVTKSVRPEPPQMKDVLLCAGAEYISTMPKKVEANLLVMSCEEDRSLCQAAIKAGIPIVSAEFVLTGILRQEVDVDSFRLFSSEVGGGRGSRSDVGGGRGGARSKSKK
ncbi:mediator of DNA damage checkpoint protein 1-like isoform X2 [Haliotis asinina]|uniref:mediator of DNA damage checkpoint protein 1-like isoform X2 n=1 Tax=Haliotis asinina TaxID=109174 RepID=UPI003531EC02